jgi:hypothetical protein
MELQYLAALVIVAAALAYLGWSLWRSVTRSGKKGCASGCGGGCGAGGREEEKKGRIPLEQVEANGSTRMKSAS